VFFVKKGLCKENGGLFENGRRRGKNKKKKKKKKSQEKTRFM